MAAEPIHYYDRYTRTVKAEVVYGEKWVRFAYENLTGRFFVWLVAFHALFAVASEPIVAATRHVLLWSSAGHLHAVTGSTDLFTLGESSFRVVPECTAVPALSELTAVILAASAPVPWKAIGAVVGSLLLWGLNSLRVVAVAVAMNDWPKGGVFVHYTMQCAMLLSIFLLLGAWVVWRPRRWGR